MTTKSTKGAALFAALFFSSTSYADVDYACQNNCISKGYMLQYCQQACSYNTNSNNGGLGQLNWTSTASAYQGLQQHTKYNPYKSITYR